MSEPLVTVELLGELRVRRGEEYLDLGQRRQRALLAILAVRSPHAVSRAALIDGIWGERPPGSAEGSVHTYVAGLRRVLEPHRQLRSSGELLVTTDSGYVLRLGECSRDVDVFQRHLDRAGHADGPSAAVDEYSDALRLWRGAPLAELPGPFAESERARLVELRLATVEKRAEAALAAGRHGEVLTELLGLVREQPEREKLAGLLMHALYCCGRTAEALDVFRSARAHLAATLGIDPGPELQGLHNRILAKDPTLVTAPRPAPRAIAELPHDVVDFVGREAELKHLLEATSLAVVVGSGGIGKSALAVRFAQQVIDRFPDGQLYLNLKGFDPRHPPLASAEALELLLRTLGADLADVPATSDARSALLRSLLAGRKMLLLLDDAVSSEQVRPLLPGGRSCFVLVTSRYRLSGLVAREGASRVALDVLSEQHGMQLLSAVLGGRVADEPERAAELTKLCGGMPLALRVAAERAAARPHSSLAELVGELADERVRLDLLAAEDDDSTAVRATISWSYHALVPDARRMFRLLGLHPGAEFSLPAAAALADLPLLKARDLLETLCAAHLLQQVGTHRYRLHDLIRLYTVEQAESETDKRAAFDRLVDWYLRTADAADRAVFPDRARIPLDDLPFSTSSVGFTDYGDAVRWCDAEQENLANVALKADESGRSDITWKIVAALGGYFTLCVPREIWQSISVVALEAARTSGDRRGEALMHNNLTNAVRAQGRLGEARDSYEQTLELWRAVGDVVGEAGTLNNLATVYADIGAREEAMAHYQRAVDLLRGERVPVMLCMVLNNMGKTARQAGRPADALAHLREALSSLRGLDVPQAEGLVLANLGDAYRDLGRLTECLDHLTRALRLHRRNADLRCEANTLVSLAEACDLMGDVRAADAHRRAAEVVQGRLGRPHGQNHVE